MLGSPAISNTEPRTKPPPVTRSSSATPDVRRGASCASPANASSAKSLPFEGLRPGPAGRSAPSWANVFHSPQASHLPCQREAVAPQFWQMKLRLRLDMEESPVFDAQDAKTPLRTIQEHSLRKSVFSWDGVNADKAGDSGVPAP